VTIATSNIRHFLPVFPGVDAALVVEHRLNRGLTRMLQEAPARGLMRFPPTWNEYRNRYERAPNPLDIPLGCIHREKAGVPRR